MTDTLATDPPTTTPQTAPVKLDPETLSIRSRPTRAIRFRRGAIIGAAALGSASLMGVAWMALKPPVFRQTEQDPQLPPPMANLASDAVSGFPASQGEGATGGGAGKSGG